MRNSICKHLMALGLVVWGLAAQSALADGAGQKVLSGHVPTMAKNLASTGDLPSDTSLQLALGLPLRNTDAMNAQLQSIYDPNSPNYHHYLTPQEFTAQFGPTEQDYEAVKAFARSNGLEVVGTHANRLLVDVRGSAANIDKAFHVKIKKYHHPTENRDFYAPDSEPVISSSLPVMHVSGLENFYRTSPRIHPSNIKHSLATVKSNLGSSPGGGYQGQDFRNAYVPGATLTGTGQNVALFQVDGYYLSDIQTYEQQIGLTNMPVPQLVTVPVDGGTPNPTPFGNPEVSLDIEMVLSMSPGVSNIYVYEGPALSNLSVYTIFEDIFSKIANDDLAKQVSTSWYIVDGVADPVSEEIFQQMAFQGQSMFAASGDVDAYVGFIPFPSDSPHLTLVGGTTLTTQPPTSGGGYVSEMVWNWDVTLGPFADGIGSSGGISQNYTIPTWQTNVSMTINQGSTTMRNVPDVALTGDNVWVDYGAGTNGIFGGTSCAAPLWAGYTALLNQQAVIDNHAPIGFLNPALYTIAAGNQYTNCFHDIKISNNEWSGSPNMFSAVPGYDLCDGLGTPNGTNLINVLLTQNYSNTVTHLSAPPKPYGTTLSALNGSNPNGNWNLFIMSDTPPDTGAITNGWILTLVTANPVGAAADLATTLSVAPSTNLVGSPFSFYITVTNYGPSTSTNVQLDIPLPLGLTVVSSNVSPGSIQISGGNVNWSLGTLSNGYGGALTLTCKASSGGLFTVTATSTTSTPDPNTYDDDPSATVTIFAPTPPAMSAIALAGNKTFEFNINSTPGTTNIVQVSTNLLAPGGGWVPIFTNLTGGNFLFDDNKSTNYPVRFYRVYSP